MGIRPASLLSVTLLTHPSSFLASKQTSAKFETSATGTVFGTPDIRLHGNDKFLFSGGAIQMAINLVPMRTLSWREITPEVEPAVSLTTMSAMTTP